ITVDTDDVLIENAGEGMDSVGALFSYTLADNFERLFLQGSGPLNGTGNAADNVIEGNESDNVLTGLAGNDTLAGGAGVNTLIGGTGDDIYQFDTLPHPGTVDIVVENAGEGSDRVFTGVS